MKINRIDLYSVAIPYKTVYKTSNNQTKAGKHIVVEVHTDTGTSGWGETGIISQRYPAEGATMEGMFATLKGYLAPAMLGENPLEIGKAMRKLDDVLQGNYFAKCALDHALYDLTGKAMGIPVSTLLGGKVRSTFRATRSLPLESPQRTAEIALSLIDKGYARLTLHAGLNEKEDLLALEAVRRAVGDGVPLEVDANGRYDRPTALRTVDKMEAFDIEAFEQPVAGPDFQGLSEIAAHSSIPIVADESVFTIEDAVQVCRLRSADLICLKPFKSGGLYHSKQIETVARAFHIPVSTGSMHPFGIGTAALHQFVASLPSVSVSGYGSPAERFVDDIVDESCYSYENGVVTLIDKPGLGVSVNREKLKKYTIDFARVEQ
jgi:L-alanine-DL-glutamate epimerase-like enolase superfamily enzyme